MPQPKLTVGQFLQPEVQWEYCYSPGIGCKCIAGLPPAVSCQYLFIHQGEESQRRAMLPV